MSNNENTEYSKCKEGDAECHEQEALLNEIRKTHAKDEIDKGIEVSGRGGAKRSKRRRTTRQRKSRRHRRRATRGRK